IHDIHETNFKLRKIFTKDLNGGNRFLCWDVSRARHHYMRIFPNVCTCPFPNPKTFRAMNNCAINIKPLRLGLFSCHDHIDVIATFQTMIGHRKKGIGIWRKVNANDTWFFIDDVVDKSWILMTKSIVVLSPDMGSEEIGKRSDWLAPR